MSIRTASLVATVAVLVTPAAAQQLTSTEIARVDSVFAPLTSTSGPGCSLAVSRDGNLVYSRAKEFPNNCRAMNIACELR